LPLEELSAADALFLSAHKFGGPKGVGAAIIRNDAFQPQPIIGGGGQEFRKRAGTENVAGIAGMAAALEAAVRDQAEFVQRASDWQRRLEDGVRDIAPDAVMFGEGAPRLPNTTCFAVPGIDAETALIALDLDGVAVSSGSACSSGRIEPSHVLAAMGVPAQMARGAIRVSTGWTTEDADIARFLTAFARLCGNRRRAKAA
jgi:cysteine desulfurase